MASATRMMNPNRSSRVDWGGRRDLCVPVPVAWLRNVSLLDPIRNIAELGNIMLRICSLFRAMGWTW